ncbi:MAG: thioredoxin domain-containing protein [Sterolibacterium sp.]|jgi:protein-disulfide isomerase
MKQKTVFIISAIFLLIIFVGGALFYSSQKEKDAAALADANRTALVRMHSPTLGKAEAPVIIVEFFDPACEGCRAFYPLVKKLIAANPDKIRLVLRYAPFHNGSDKVVAVLEAARKQGKFWPVLEALFASQDDWASHHTPKVELVWKHLEGIGLDMEQMAIDMTSTDIAKVVAQDLDDARTFQVTKTPEFFVNGRPLPSFGYEQLKSLVDDALAKAR